MEDIAQSSPLVVELATHLIQMMQAAYPNWDRAFFRFCMEEFSYGSNGSYISGSSVVLFDPFKSPNFFDRMNAKSAELLKLLGKKRGVLLLSVDSQLNYDVKFEFEDVNRWKITKLNGATGLPAGI